MKRILEFDDFVSNLSLSEVEQAEIKDFVLVKQPCGKDVSHLL